MENQFPYSLDNKRYHTWNYYLKQTFGQKVGKIAIDAGFTCPNIDGLKGFGGCTYCSSRGSGDFAGNPTEDVGLQYVKQREKMQQKWPEAKGLAYFQAHSNTYAPVEILRSIYGQVLSQPDLVGICIATRADVLSNDTVAYLKELQQHTWVQVELGLQTVHEKTAQHINRCHTYQEFLQGYQKLMRADIPVCIHIINGLPFETKSMMMETVEAVGQLMPQSIKIHMLHLLRGTKMAVQYEQNPFELIDMESYIQLICDQLEKLPPQIVIQRLTGDAKESDLIVPDWVCYKRRILNGIDKELARRDSWQGKLL